MQLCQRNTGSVLTVVLCVIHPWRYLQLGHVSPLLSCIENTDPMSAEREGHGNSDLGAF